MEFVINGQGSDVVKMIVILTMISVAPFLLLMMTCFTRIVIVSFLFKKCTGAPTDTAEPSIGWIGTVHHIFCHGTRIDRGQ